MKHFYLIDFENVSDAGLDGFFDLTEEDTAYLFYSLKANRISIDFFKTLLEHRCAAAIYFFKVAAGNQALDLQLASFLGSLIAANPADCDFCIISKDKGYACLSSFWLNRSGGSRLSQAASIAEALSRRAKAAAPVRAAEKPVVAPAPAEVKPAPAEAPVKPQEPHPAEAPKKAPPVEKAEPVQTPAKPVEAAPAETPAKAQEPRPAEPAQPAKPAEKPAKPAEDPAVKAKAAPAPQSEKSILNARVQQTLSKAKYDTKVIAQVASMTSKAFGDPKIKQVVYRGLIKQHGQKTGLEIYNLIKPLL